MTYVRAGTISAQPGLVTRVLDLPYRIYEFFMFFVMTLIDVSVPGKKNSAPCRVLIFFRLARAQPTAAKKASQKARERGSAAKRPVAGMKNVQGGGGGCGPGMGG